MYVYIWCFFIVSFVGWLLEVAYAAIVEKRFVNRGFLNGPICPIYGVGIVLMDFVLGRFENNMAILIAGAMILGSALEWLAGFILEKVFKQKWWDYSDSPHNLNGYICLSFSVIWGIAGAVVVRIVMPLLKGAVGLVPKTFGHVLLLSLTMIFLADLIITVVSITGLNRRLRNLEMISIKIKEATDSLGRLVSDGVLGVKEKYDDSDIKVRYETFTETKKQELDELKEKAGAFSESKRRELDEFVEKKKKELDDLKQKYENSIKRNKLHVRLLKAFPNLKSIKYNEELETLRKNFVDFTRKSSDALKKRNEDAIAAYESKVEEGQEKPFAHGICFTKLFWVFMIGNVIGFIVETFWCLLAPPHQFEWRVSVVWGPFILVYGFGAVIITLLLHKLYSRMDIWIFLLSMVIGAGFEYVCSLIQQAVFGTVSWQYDDSLLNLSGRTNLMFGFFWGILGMVWVKDIYPRISRLIEKVPKKVGRLVTVFTAVFMAVNMVMSAGAVMRQSERVNNIPATNAVQAFFDEYFDDEFLKGIYPNMQYVGTFDDFSKRPNAAGNSYPVT